MLNPKATALSRNTIPEQMEFLKQSFPFMRNFHLTDASTDGKFAEDVKMDYHGGIDVYAKDMNGYREYNIQLKVRMPEHGEDLVFIARKVHDADIRRNPKIGFTWHGEKYSFCTDYIDIYCEKVGGKFYTVRATDLMALERDTQGEDNKYIRSVQPQKYYDSFGNKFSSGDYYVFINAAKMMQFKKNLLYAENWDYYQDVYQNEQEQ